MLHEAEAPIFLWAESVNTANVLRNLALCKANDWKSPHELWYKQPAPVDNLFTFGCSAYKHVPKKLRRNLEPKSVKCGLV